MNQQNQQSKYALSIRTDGRLSIEHQLSIHVNDLIDAYRHDDAAQNSSDQAQRQSDFSLMEVLAGIRYVMDYRIKGGKQPNLDAQMMKKLCDGLVLHMKFSDKGLIKSKPTPESNMAFGLFSDFVEEVAEFRRIVAAISVADLAYALKLHRRIKYSELRPMVVQMIIVLTTYLPDHFSLQELVKKDSDDIQEAVDQLGPQIKQQLDQKKQKSQNNYYDQELFPPPALYSDRRIKRVVHMFKTSVENGLTTDQVEKARHFYGTNQLPAPKTESPLKMLFSQITDFMIIILIIAAAVSAGFGDFKAAIVLLIVVVLNVLLGFVQEYKASRALNALLSLTVPRAQVIRNGIKESIDSTELVPGDIVVLDEGDAVPADLRLVETAQLEIVESILTGESVPVAKSPDEISAITRKLPLGDCKGNAFMSTVVARGRGTGIVVRTGERTEIGKISSAIANSKDIKTPMQERLQKLGIILVILSVVLCALVVIIGVARNFDAFEMVKVGVSLAVSVIPEGLVAVTTVTMAIGVRRMAQKNAIIRKLPGVETLGGVTVICSDKTGTLTEGNMSVSELWTADGNNISGKGYGFTGGSDLLSGQIFEKVDINQPVLSSHSNLSEDTKVIADKIEECPAEYVWSMMNCALCNNSDLREEDGEMKRIGDPTEIALLVSSKKAKMDVNFWKNNYGAQRIAEFAFDSDRKLMSVVYGLDKLDGKNIILAKGAPEPILEKCTHRITSSDKFNFDLEQDNTKAIDDEFLNVVSAQSQRMASQGLRVLGMAVRVVDSQTGKQIIESQKNELSEKDLVFIGLIGMIDPPRKGIKDSIVQCKKAGIKVIMITGDHIITAMAIAQNLGILVPDNPEENRAMKGVELDILSEDALKTLDPFPRVFARVSPDNKLRIVQFLQMQGETVAMTGDGVNDAPAIKQANVGIAMGISGTEITKQAADMVLSDDNFVTIVSAVEEGRRVFDNIQKFVVYLLSCNFAEIFVMLMSLVVGVRVPFTSMMILYANIIADIPPSMSIGIEPVEADAMDRPPRDPKKGVLTKTAGLVIMVQSVLMGAISLGVYLYDLSIDGRLNQENVFLSDPRAQTHTYMALTTMQLVQSFLSRSVESSILVTGIFGNLYMVGAFIFSYIFMLMAIFIPGFAAVFDLVALNRGDEWLIIFIAVVIHILLSEIFKFALRRYRSSKQQQSKHEIEMINVK